MEESLLQYLVEMVGPVGILVASGLGSLVVLAQVVVPLTPTLKDDEAWAKVQSVPLVGGLLKALIKFAPIQKK